MDIHLNHGGVCLARNQSFAISNGKGYRVVCHSGSVWITQDNDPRDVILARGESFTLDREGHALVQAFDAATVAVKATAANDVQRAAA
jgi:Protein of unknown function (DUF2917)